MTRYTWSQLTETDSPAYNRMGELHFIDGDKNPIITLCYVQNQPIKGIDNFVLISNNTLDAIQTDINYHSSMCAHVGICPLRRLVSHPHHYSDKVKHAWLNDSDTILHIKVDDQVTDKQSISLVLVLSWVAPSVTKTPQC